MWRRFLMCAVALGGVIVGLSTQGCGGAPSEEVCADTAREDGEAVLQKYCYSCHGLTDPASAGLDVTDDEDLSARQKIVWGDPESSLLYQRMATNQMPPSSAAERPDAAEIEAVRQWIECGPYKGDAAPPVEQVSLSDTIRLMREDLELDVPDHQKPFTRYLVLTHLRNAGMDETGLQRYRIAMTKLVNSLSRGPVVVVPQAIDTAGTIYRIYLPDYDWEAQAGVGGSADRWETLVQNYPYGLALLNNEDHLELAAETGTSLPWIRADWLVHDASAPPLYYDMLRIPPTAQALEQQLGVNVGANLQNQTAKRAGFGLSLVSNANRMIERHASSFGAYWRSYDFASSLNEKNVLQNPLGPSEWPAPFHFVPDGGEMIFTLPNGLHGFMIVNAQGTRLNGAPTSIVFDKQQSDGVVRSGRSCMACHREGIIKKEDEVRGHYATPDANVPIEVLDEIEALYVPKEEMDILQQADRADYLDALTKVGANPQDQEPVMTSSFEFEQTLDVNRVAAELWVKPELVANNPDVLDLLAPLSPDTGTPVKRDVFEARFVEVVCKLKQYTPVFHGIAGCATGS